MDPSPRGAVALVHAHAKVCTDVAWPRLDLAIAICAAHPEAHRALYSTQARFGSAMWGERERSIRDWRTGGAGEPGSRRARATGAHR